MSDDLKNILNNSNKDIDNQQLMDYLSNHIHKADAHEVEKAMTDDAFVNDAVEGLQQMQGGKNITASVERLNDELNRQIKKNKKRKGKRRLKDSPYNYIAVIIILLLIIICYVVLKKYMGSAAATGKTAVSIIVTQKKLT